MAIEATPAKPFDAEGERARINSALLSVTADLAEARDADALLERFANLLVDASPHFRLAWLYIGPPEPPCCARNMWPVRKRNTVGRCISTSPC